MDQGRQGHMRTRLARIEGRETAYAGIALDPGGDIGGCQPTAKRGRTELPADLTQGGCSRIGGHAGHAAC